MNIKNLVNSKVLVSALGISGILVIIIILFGKYSSIGVEKNKRINLKNEIGQIQGALDQMSYESKKYSELFNSLQEEKKKYQNQKAKLEDENVNYLKEIDYNKNIMNKYNEEIENKNKELDELKKKNEILKGKATQGTNKKSKELTRLKKEYKGLKQKLKELNDKL